MSNNKEKIKFLPVYSDTMFKNLFGVDKNIEFTTDMLEALFNLEPGTLEGTIIKNSVRLDRETVILKKFELDVVVELPNGDILNLEMQCVYDKNSEKKNFMYVTGLFYSQLKVGEDYSNTKKVTGINFIKNNSIHENSKVIQKYVMTNEDNPEDKMLPDLFNVLTISVDHNCEIFYNEISEKFECWRRFIGADTLEELESISKSYPILERAYEECVRFMSIDYVQDYEADERLRRSQMKSSKEEGIETGKLEEKYEIAKMMLSNNEELEKVIMYTSLSKDELENLKEEMNN